MDGKEHIRKSVSAKNDFAGSGKLVDCVEDLIPGVLGHETNERIQTDDGLLIEMVKNGRREHFGNWMLTQQMMNIRS